MAETRQERREARASKIAEAKKKHWKRQHGRASGKANLITREKLDEINKSIDEKLSELIRTGKYKDLLLLQGNMGHYSIYNTLWLLFQCELRGIQMSTVHSFNQWKRLGRNVKAGETHLTVLQPLPTWVDDMVPVLDKDGNQVFDEKGNAVAEKVGVKKIINHWRPFPVFDLSQTEGKELQTYKLGAPLLDPTADFKDAETIKESVQRLLEGNGYKVSFLPQRQVSDNPGVNGTTDYHDMTVQVRNDRGSLATLKTLFHEAGHALSTSEETKNQKKAIAEFDKQIIGGRVVDPIPFWRNVAKLNHERPIREVEAESVACVVAQHLGMDTSGYSFAYMLSWGEDKVTEFRQKCLGSINKTAKEVIDAIDKALYREKEKEGMDTSSSPFPKRDADVVPSEELGEQLEMAGDEEEREEEEME